MAALPDRTRLADLVASLDDFDRAGRDGIEPTIFAVEPWHPASPAVVLSEQAHDGRAPSMPSYSYMLEVELATAVLTTWTSRRSGSVPSPEQAAEAVIHYAAHDSHQPATCHWYGCGRPGPNRCTGCGGLMCGRHAVVSGSTAECSACSAHRAAKHQSHQRIGAGGRRRTSIASGGLQLGGALSLGLAWAVGSEPLLAVGACLLMVGACIWLGAFVMRLMG